MPETAPLPATIRARVHEDAIGRVTRFFNATTTETLNELFQNARRAGATRIDVQIANGTVTVTDDGGGIADPAALLAFGQTGWSADTARHEDPAGMGVYALARCPQVIIRSRRRPANDDGPAAPGWQVRLTPAHFLGKERAAVETVADDRMLFGTSVVFEDAKAVGGDVKRAARYFPLPVDYKGEELQRQDFLRDALYTEEWRGIRIGVYAFGGRQYWLHPRLNFHGVLVDELHLPGTASMDTHWHVRTDVIDCPQLELVLPARKEVVETPFVDQLRTACRRAAYRAMLARDPGVDVAASVRADAIALGIELPVASQRLQPWKPAYADEYFHRRENPGRGRFPADAIVIDADIPTCDQQTLWRAADRAGITHRLFQSDERLKGYDWYDHLTRATALTTTFTVNGRTETIEQLRKSRNPPDTCQPEAITFTLYTVDAGGTTGELEIPGDVAFGDDELTWAEDLDLLVARDSDIRPHELAELMHDACFSPSDDAEADSYETQSNDYRQAAESTALRLLVSAEEARLADLRNTVHQYIRPHIPRDHEMTIRVRGDEATEIEITPMQAKENQGVGTGRVDRTDHSASPQPPRATHASRA